MSQSGTIQVLAKDLLSERRQAGPAPRHHRLPSVAVLGSVELRFYGVPLAFRVGGHGNRWVGRCFSAWVSFLLSLIPCVAQAHPEPRGAFGFQIHIFFPLSADCDCFSFCLCPAETLGMGWEWVCCLNQAVSLSGTFCPLGDISSALPKCL